jgi:hypothetical protein
MPIDKLNQLIENRVIKDSLYGSGLGLYEEVIDEGWFSKEPVPGERAVAAAAKLRNAGLKGEKRVADAAPSPTTGKAVPLSDKAAQAEQALKVSTANSIAADIHKALVSGKDKEVKDRETRAAGVSTEPTNPGAKDSLDSEGQPVFDDPADVAFRSANRRDQGPEATRVAAWSAAAGDRPQAEVDRLTRFGKEEIRNDVDLKTQKYNKMVDFSLTRADAEEKSRVEKERADLKDFRLASNQKGFIGRFLDSRKANKVEKELDAREGKIGKLPVAKNFKEFQKAKLERADAGAKLMLQDRGLSLPAEGSTHNAGAGPGPGGNTGEGSGPGPATVDPDLIKNFTDPDAVAAKDVSNKKKGTLEREGRSSGNYYNRVATPRAYANIAGAAFRPLASVFNVMTRLGQNRPR